MDRRRFPALDPEPPPGERRRRFALITAVCVLVAALVAGLSLALSSSRSGSGRVSALPSTIPASGRIVLIDSAGYLLATARPDGTELSPLPALGKYEQGVPVASSDGKLLATRDGTIISFAGATPAIMHTALRLGPRQVVSTLGPFADHDRDVVVFDKGPFGYQSASGDLSVVDLSTGTATSLGVADRAAGDPHQPGAFVSVPGPETGASPDGQVMPPDSAVELRDAGASPVTLITAEQAADVVGLDPSTAVVLYPVPDPTGESVAITVAPADGEAAGGLVVVDRTGKDEGEVLASVGVTPTDPVAWSPDGSTLAYIGPGQRGSELSTWTSGGGTSVRAVPSSGPTPFGCMWSPDGAALLCYGAGGSPRRAEWYVAGAGPGPVAAIPAPGFPITWIADGQRGGSRS